MSLGIYNSAAFTNSAGVLVAPGALVEVRKESDNSLATIYSDKTGLSPISQPGFVAGADGVFVFYAVGIADGYKVTVTSGVLSVTLRNQATGNARYLDTSQLRAAMTIDTTDTPTFAQVVVAADPTTALQVATKQYVDNFIAGLSPKPNARAATTGSITISNPGTAVFDGITLTSGQFLLVRAQASALQNGLYVFNGSASALTRHTQMDAWTEVPGAFVIVEEGSTFADTAWMCSADRSGTLGVTAINWLQFPAIGGTFQPLDADLTAVAALPATAGFLSRTGADAFSARTLTGTTNQVSITNGSGSGGDPVFSLPQSINTGATVQFSVLRAGDGSNTIPSVSFASDTNSGLYWVSSDNIAMTLGGTAMFTWALGQINVFPNTVAPTGMFMANSSTLAFGSAGTKLVGLNSAGTGILEVNDGVTVGALRDLSLRALTTSGAINKVTLTAPATSATITIADGKTLTANNSLTLAGTDATTLTFPAETCSVGFRGMPQQSKSAAYTTVLGDAGKHIYHPVGDNNARTFTIDSNANVAYDIGTMITFVNEINVVTIAITTDTMVLAGTASTGSRTLAANGVATAVKVTSTRWYISGTGLT